MAQSNTVPELAPAAEPFHSPRRHLRHARHACRAALSLACAGLYLVLMVAWVRSYYGVDRFNAALQSHRVSLESWRGVIQVSAHTPGVPRNMPPLRPPPAFELSWAASGFRIRAPIWLYGFLVIMLGVAPWITIKSFGLRTMLLAFTIGALFLGAIVVWT